MDKKAKSRWWGEDSRWSYKNGTSRSDAEMYSGGIGNRGGGEK